MLLNKIANYKPDSLDTLIIPEPCANSHYTPGALPVLSYFLNDLNLWPDFVPVLYK